MDAAHGAAAPTLSATTPTLSATAPALSSGPHGAGLGRLSQSIREYSLFQGVLLALDRLRAVHPELDEQALYERLDFQANPSLGFPGSDIDAVEFYEERGYEIVCKAHMLYGSIEHFKMVKRL